MRTVCGLIAAAAALLLGHVRGETVVAAECLKGVHPNAADKLEYALRKDSSLIPRFSGAVFGTEHDGLMYAAQAVGASFDYVQVVDLSAMTKLSNARSSVMSVVQDQISAMPNTLFVVKGVESLSSAADMALLDAFHDLLEDGEVTVAGGAVLRAPGAGVLVAVDTEALRQSTTFKALSAADKANAKSLTDPSQLLQAVLSAHGRAANGGAVFTPSSFVGRVRSFIALDTLTDAQRVQLAQLRAAGPGNSCSHAGLVAATAANQPQGADDDDLRASNGAEELLRRVADVWMDPHFQNVLLPRCFAAFLVVFLGIFAFVPGSMPPKGAYHHPLAVYPTMDAMIAEEDAQPCEVDVTGEGRWEGPAPADRNPKRKHADIVAAKEAAPPGIKPGHDALGSDESPKAGTRRRPRRRSSGGSPRTK